MLAHSMNKVRQMYLNLNIFPVCTNLFDGLLLKINLQFLYVSFPKMRIIQYLIYSCHTALSLVKIFDSSRMNVSIACCVSLRL